MADPGAGRAWRAACPHCGAPVEFRSAASPMAVCSYCQSTLVRDGETLRRIGRTADLFDDHSPLGLGARGSFNREPFTLIGRLQYRYRDAEGDEGRWTSWHALFDNGRGATLSEDNGAYVLSFPQPQPSGAQDVPGLALRDLTMTVVGGSVAALGRGWTLASRVQAQVHALEGEWPFVLSPEQLAQPFEVWELRNPAGEVLSIEAITQPPQVDVGRAVDLIDLQFSGLPDRQSGDAGRAKVRAQGLSCPSCGNSLTPTLDSTQTIVCGSCKAVVDISKGLGADLACYRQENVLEPLIALGSRGQLALGGRTVNWQVVGYQERCNVPASADEEAWFWREYLLYAPQAGFAFLVDALDGWSLVRPVTGAPRTSGTRALLDGVDYRQKEGSYTALTTRALGEFYWPVRKDQRSLNTDYAGTGQGASLVLNREMSGNEVVWSQGRVLQADEVMKAFAIATDRKREFKRDASLTSASWSASTWYTILFFAAIIVLILAMNRCDGDCASVRDTYGESSAEYQQCRASSGSGGGYHGGSYGGYSTGGFHK